MNLALAETAIARIKFDVYTDAHVVGDGHVLF